MEIAFFFFVLLMVLGPLFALGVLVASLAVIVSQVREVAQRRQEAASAPAK